MASKSELKDAYLGTYQSKDLPYKLIQACVEQMKTFLLGDGYQKRIKFLALQTDQQENLNQKLEEIQLYRILSDAVIDALVYGEAYLDCSNNQLRHIPTDKVTQVNVDPSDPFTVVYLKEQRETYNPNKNAYDLVDVEHYLQLPETQELNPLELPSYQYFVKVGTADPIPSGDSIPIVRLVNSINGRSSISAIERLIHLQAEYNDLRRRIDTNGRHHKPIPFTLGTSLPSKVGRTNREASDSLFDVEFKPDAATLISLPISNQCLEAGLLPKVGYLQPLDSPYLERQRLIILQDIYNLSGVMVLELQNARSASSSNSLGVLYEPLQRATLGRASYLIPAIQKVLALLSIAIPFRIQLPDMLPRDLLDKKLQIEAVQNKLISRKRYLIEVEGLTEEEALQELEQLDQEKGLAIQYSAALVDSTDAPSSEPGIFEQSAIN